MIGAYRAVDFAHFVHAMSIDSALAVYRARLACFCRHTLPQIDARNMNEAVRAGIVFG